MQTFGPSLDDIHDRIEIPGLILWVPDGSDALFHLSWAVLTVAFDAKCIMDATISENIYTDYTKESKKIVSVPIRTGIIAHRRERITLLQIHVP